MRGDPIVHRDDLGVGIVLVPDPDGCGIGMGARCCAYLVVGEGGTQRSTPEWRQAMRSRHVDTGTMVSVRRPTEPLFDCQLPAGEL